VLTPADDYPLHQSSRPFRDPGVDRNLYDRFFFNGYPITGELAGSAYFACALGQYVGRNIMDGAFSVIVDGVQRNVRGSRLLGADRLDLHVGPVRVEIVEPLRRLRIVVDAPEAGIAADLTLTARGPAFEEPHYRWAPGHLTVFDLTRLTQNGEWEGWIDVHGRDRITVTPSVWRGTRDRSWGTRPIGARETNTAPDGQGGFYWLWAPINFHDMNVLFDVNEYPDGTRWHDNAMIAGLGTNASIASGSHRYETQWRPGTRHADGFTIDMTFTDRAPIRIELESVLTFFMQGIGYTHPTWGHGMWVGPNERSHDELGLANADERDPGLQHVQILSRATRDDGATGWGILEMLIIGPHTPSGFHDVLDMRH
jgi:hypothetical protein